MLKIEAYPKVIDILTKEIDYKKLVIQIAKDNPQAIINAYRKIKTNVWETATIDTSLHPVYGKESWYYIVLKLILQKKQVSAIKEHRFATGFGLKESKELCEEIRDFLRNNNLMD